ncbi:MAG: hypothetical protein H7343_01145 [Undibacterium sp.]|nr:hypothetical protein [Opitutaceae bacterium]
MNKSRLLRHLLPVSVLLIGTPLASTALRAQTVDSAVADAKGGAIKTMLKDLDREIDRLDEFADNAPNAGEKAAAKARLEVLKNRRSELRKNYVKARYDGLKADVKIEYNKVSAWTKKTFSNSPESKIERKLDHATDKTKEMANDTAQGAREMKADVRAAVNPSAVATTADIAAYKMSPTEENKADVKASLASLDAEIDRLEARVDNVPKGDEREATKVRVKALKGRRSELSSNFRKARYEALKDDVKAEWKKLTS